MKIFELHFFKNRFRPMYYLFMQKNRVQKSQYTYVPVRYKELASGIICTFSSLPMYTNLPSERTEGVFLIKFEFRTWFHISESIPVGIDSSWNRVFPLPMGIGLQYSLAPNRWKKSMPRLKINILWSMGNPLPNPLLRIDSKVQICFKIPPQERGGCSLFLSF